MAAIMMPQQIDSAIKAMCGDAMAQAVAALADKYGFDAEEANRFLDTTELKIVRKRGPSPKAVKEVKSTKSKASSKEVTGDKPKPKRAKSGYLLYADEIRAEVRLALASELEEGEKVKPQDVVRSIAARWQEEDQEDRDAWNAKAKTPITSDDDSVDVE